MVNVSILIAAYFVLCSFLFALLVIVLHCCVNAWSYLRVRIQKSKTGLNSWYKLFSADTSNVVPSLRCFVSVPCN